MKTIKLLALIAVILFSASTDSIYAQRKKKKEVKEEIVIAPPKENVVTEECMQNLSLLTTSCKQKNYADALAPWESVYNECPSAHKNIYILGVRIIDWQIRNATDEATKEALFVKLMRLHDEQIEYFAKESKTDRARILARKGQYYLIFKPQDKKAVYPWFKEAIETLGGNSGLAPLQQFVVLSSELCKVDSTLAETFIADYTLTNGHLETIISNPNAKNHAKYVELKNSLDALFVLSGVADCAKLNEIYRDAIEENKTNNDYLLRTMRFFKRLKCTNEESYFAAAKYSHNITPNAESAMGLGNMSYSKDEYTQAITYYTNAVELFDNNDDKADAFLRIAQCYYKEDNSIKTREYCKKSLEMNPAQGAPHIILGLIYASAGTISEDAVLNKAKFWVVVDQFIKAKNAEQDPTIEEQANKQISIYKAYFPTKEEIFMHPELGKAGNSYYVGSWIKESTLVRSK